MNDHNFEFYLPAGAKVEQVQARAPNGQPISADAVPQAEKNRYAIAFPLRPGETQFQLGLHAATLRERSQSIPSSFYSAKHFVVVLPKTMQFKGRAFANVRIGEGSHAGRQHHGGRERDEARRPSRLHAGKEMESSPNRRPRVLRARSKRQSPSPGQPQDQPPAQGRDNRPGGGLGVPIDAPDALRQYRWPILGVIRWCSWRSADGWSAKRQPVTFGRRSVGGSGEDHRLRRSAPSGPSASSASIDIADLSVPAARSSMLLEALEKSLFQLEIEKKQGKIWPKTTKKARAALDQTLDRALKRQS